MTITIFEQATRFVAVIDRYDHQTRGNGPTVEAAIGAAILDCPRVLGVTITHEGSKLVEPPVTQPKAKRRKQVS